MPPFFQEGENWFPHSDLWNMGRFCMRLPFLNHREDVGVPARIMKIEMDKMKKWLGYLVLLLCGCLVSCSDTSEPSFSGPKGAWVELWLSMPESLQRAPADGGEPGSAYENMMAWPDDLHLFVFDEHDVYCGEVTSLQFFGDDSNRRIVRGALPESVLNRKVKLLLMANYALRGVIFPARWSPELCFEYGEVPWHPYDRKYIPMSGSCEIDIGGASIYTSEVFMQRAVSKVRLQMHPDCPLRISRLEVKGAQSRGYCLPHPGGRLPEREKPLDRVLSFAFSGAERHEFYLPEQPAEKTTLEVELTDGYVCTLHFRYVQEDAKSAYALQRNYLYQFRIRRKSATAVDVQVEVSPWKVVDLCSDYE